MVVSEGYEKVAGVMGLLPPAGHFQGANPTLMGEEDERVVVFANDEFDVFGELIVDGVDGHFFGDCFLCTLFLGI